MSGESRRAITADIVFDGAVAHRNAAVIVEGGDIAGVLPPGDLPQSVSVERLPAGIWLAPGFIDVQVNGGGDVLFNDSPTPDAIRAIAAAHRHFGTTSLLPTFITDSPAKMAAAVDAAEQLIGLDPCILGIHLEGPFLSPQKPGVHAPEYIRQPDDADVALLTRKRKGAMLVTLAPEQVPAGFVRRLTGAGIRVSLGHSMATYEQSRAAIAEGMTGFTHLFNAMRPLASRDPGPIAAALECPDVWFGMIVDGFHVDPAVLRIALRGLAKPMLVTDAMPPVGGTRAEFTLYGETIRVSGGKQCTREDGVLAGSVLDMAAAVRNCVRLIGMPLETALRLASIHPAAFLGLDRRLGRLARGYRADMVALDPDKIEVVRSWVAGASTIDYAAQS